MTNGGEETTCLRRLHLGGQERVKRKLRPSGHMSFEEAKSEITHVKRREREHGATVKSCGNLTGN